MIRWIRDIVLQPVIGIVGLLVAGWYLMFDKKNIVSKEWVYSPQFKVSFFVITVDKRKDSYRKGICLLRVIIMEKPDKYYYNGQEFLLSPAGIEIEKKDILLHETYHYPQQICLPGLLFPLFYAYSHLIGWIYKIDYNDRWFEK